MLGVVRAEDFVGEERTLARELVGEAVLGFGGEQVDPVWRRLFAERPEDVRNVRARRRLVEGDPEAAIAEVTQVDAPRLRVSPGNIATT